MADPARDLFEEFRTGGFTRIQRCLESKEPETAFLDYKRNCDEKGNVSGKLEKTGKKVLAKALSAFANAGGGTLVWGIEDRNERAEAGHPIPNVREFVVQLYKSAPELVYPPLDGVIHEAIPDPKGSGEGYAITYIPDGKVKPHMSTAPDQWTYFLRTGESSKAMPDAAVRAFVKSGSRPSLKLHTEVGQLITSPIRTDSGTLKIGRLEASIKVFLINDGQSAADRCALAIEYAQGLSQSTMLLRFVNVGREGDRFSAMLFSPAALTIYPGTDEQVFEVNYQTTNVHVADRLITANEDLVFRYAIFAEGFTEYGSTVVPKEKLRRPL